MITWVDDEGRHEALPHSRSNSAWRRSRSPSVATPTRARPQKMEADLAELEAEGAKSEVAARCVRSGERETRGYSPTS